MQRCNITSIHRIDSPIKTNIVRKKDNPAARYLVACCDLLQLQLCQPSSVAFLLSTLYPTLLQLGT